MPFSLSPPSSLLKLPIVVIQRFCYHGNMTFTLTLLRVLRFFFWAACVTEWKIIFVIYSPGLKFTIKLLYYHLGQISMYRIIDTCIMNVKRFWVPLLQLLVNSFCLFIYYYYIIIIIIIIIIVIIIVIVIIIIISCIFFCRKHKQTSGRGKISVPRY